MNQLTLIFVLCYFLTAFCQDIPWPPKEGYMIQDVDHFNFISVEHENITKFKQRFLFEDKWYKSGGPIFFYCGNEGSIEGFWNNTGFMFELAPKFNALIIFGEHRYYGKSLPFGSQNSFIQPFIQFLSVEQALADYAYMIPSLKLFFNAKSSKVIAFGGSYGGCLAAYMRFKYPNIVDGALAASAPIAWVSGSSGFHKFFEVITNDFNQENPQCVNIVRQGFKQMSDLASQGLSGYHINEILK